MTDEEYREPTGYKTIKQGGREYYRYVYEAGEGTRFVNSNKRCVGCLLTKKCYIGRHSIVMCCQEKKTK